MIILNRRFKPSWLMTIITLVVVVIFVKLGMWQLDRADFKDEVKGKFESRLETDYQLFSAADSFVDIDYRNLTLNGEFDLSRTILVDNKLFEGRAGYDVLTPFILSGSRKVVLVNRGWVALGNSRDILPVIELPLVLDEVKGIASVPTTEGFRMGVVSLTDSWPQVVPFIDIEAMQESFPGGLLPLVLWLAPDQPGYYQRSWNPVWADPEKSRAYALQWFIFALIAVGLYLFLNLRKVE
ncbi:MAG: surfeit locus 1 family protein [Gammaproteobacteria bacterium]|jgi:surfeit locus 1 family protein